MFRFWVYPECTKQVDLLNLSSLVTVSVALSRPRAAKAKPGKATNAMQSGPYGNSLKGEASQEPKGGRGAAETLSMERGEVVMEWWCASGSTLLPCHGGENIGGPALPTGPV